MFRLLGLHPGPDIAAPAAGSLAGADAPRQRAACCASSPATTCSPSTPRPVRLPRPAARLRRRAGRRDRQRPARQPRAARRDSTTTCTPPRAAAPGAAGEQIALAPPRPSAAPGQPGDRQQALAWFEAEHHVLLAAVALAADSGLFDHAWQISLVMHPILAAHGHNAQWTALKRAHMAAGVRDEAALIASGARDVAGTLGDYEWVPEYYATMAKLHQRLGNRRGPGPLCLTAPWPARHKAETDLLNAVGWYHGLLGDYQRSAPVFPVGPGTQRRPRQPPPGGRYLQQPGLRRIPRRRLRRGGRLLRARAAHLPGHRRPLGRSRYPHPPWRHPPRRRRAPAGPASLAAGTRHPRRPPAPRRRQDPRQTRQPGLTPLKLSRYLCCWRVENAQQRIVGPASSEP